jgi:hypothetical protein
MLKARRRITIWPDLRIWPAGRGDLTFWLDETALSGWQAPRRTSRGGQPIYADMAIEVVLTLRLVFHLALRQAEGFTRSVLRLLGLEIAVPDHSTLSRRSRGFAGTPSSSRISVSARAQISNKRCQSALFLARRTPPDP